MAGVITSVKARPVAAARRLGKRAFRAADRAFLVEGPQGVREALGEVGALRALFATEDGAARHPDLLDRARAAGVDVHLVSGDVMAQLAQTVTPQGVLGVAPLRAVPLDDIVARRPRLVVVLAAVRDPGNAGTVLRTADAAGADAVVFTAGSVDPYNGKCVRASAGSLFHIRHAVGATAVDTVAALRAQGSLVAAATGEGTEDLFDLADAGRLRAPTAWVLGNEAWGLSSAVRELADLTVRVPIHGRAESLNLATAAAVCLYASAHAHRRSPA